MKTLIKSKSQEPKHSLGILARKRTLSVLFTLCLCCLSYFNGHCQIDFLARARNNYPYDAGTLIVYPGDIMFDVEVTFDNDTNSDHCDGITGYDIDPDDCGHARCSLDLSNGQTNYIRWSALKVVPGTVSGQFAAWKQGYMVTMLDCYIIQEHISDEAPFWAMCQYISADADGNGTVNDLDIEVIQDCILGVALPLMPSWTYIAAHWTTVYSSQDFFDWMTMLDPTPEDFEDLYGEYYEAFNRIDNSTLTVGEYSTTYSTPPYTYDQGIEFNGFKIGDVNYTVMPFDDCPNLWEGPNEVLSTRNARIIGRESIAEVTLKSYYSTSELEIFIDNISEIKALQIEIPFEGSDVYDIKLLSTTLPMFTDANFHYDLEANILRCVWFDRKGKQELRNERSDSKTTLTFKVNHSENSEISIRNSAENSFNLIGVYGNKLDVPLKMVTNVANTSKKISYSLNEDLIEFNLDGYDFGYAELHLYTVAGQLIGSYKSPIIDRTVRFMLPTRKSAPTVFVYQLLTPIHSQTGKFIIFE